MKEISLPKLKRRVVSRRFLRKNRRVLRSRRKRPSLRRTLATFLESRPVILALLLPTFYLLFVHDAVSASGAAWTRSLSAGVGACDLLMAVVFSLELIANVIAYRRKYIISWFSILDLIAILSLIPDILQFLFLVDVNSDLAEFKMARVARTARLATRMARLPKILNLISCGKTKKDETAGLEPSAIAMRLQTRTSAKVIVAVLLILLVATLCSQSPNLTPHAQLALQELQTVAIASNFTGPVYQQVLDLYTTKFTILELDIAGNTIINQQDVIKHTQSIYMTKIHADLSHSIIEDKSEQKEIYILSIVQTICTILILFLACLLISRDMLILVIRPIERMLALIKKLTSTISTHSADSSRYDSDYASEDDEDENENDEGVAGASDDVESQVTGTDIDDDDEDMETNLLVDFVDILAKEQMDLEQHRREEHHRRLKWI
eukprot:Phypoly_transcript_02497.p1 GENE.Phypoly_transcript_02497~~Phypoly_transcript_02497.p1  ORF type:complete len:437 (+),score=71.79 Phypoly_transcript_02497:260-1570(+)